LNAADNVDNMANQLQLSTQSVQSMSVMMEEAGMSVSSLANTMATLDNKLSEAQSGNESARKSFESLGLSVDKLAGMTPERALEAVARSLYENQGNASATAGAYDVLGTRAGRMKAVIMELGSKGFANLNREMLDSAKIMSEDMVKAGDKMEESLDRAMRRLAVKRNTFMTKFMGGLEVRRQQLMGKSMDEISRDLFGGEAPISLADARKKAAANRSAAASPDADISSWVNDMASETAALQKGHLQQMKNQLAMMQDSPMKKQGGLNFGSMRDLNRVAQSDMQRRRQEKMDEERNKRLKEIKDAITRQESGMAAMGP